MSLTDSLSSRLSKKIRDRGQGYFHSGAVTLEAVTREEVSATVLGSDAYLVKLTLAGRDVVASCTCPYVDDFGTTCKHIWATILAAEPRGFASGVAAGGLIRLGLNGDDVEFEDGFDEDVGEPDFPPPRYSYGRPAPARKGWEGILTDLKAELAPGGTIYSQRSAQNSQQQLVFIIDAPASEQGKKVVLEIGVQERKKNGEWSKPRSRHITVGDLDEQVDPLGRQILTLLNGADRGYYGYSSSYGYSYGALSYRLVGPLLDSVFPLFAQSGRVRLRQNTRSPAELQDLIPDSGAAWGLTLAVNADRTGKNWVLSGRLTRGDESMELTDPALIVSGLVVWGGRFGQFDDAGALAWVSALRRVGPIVVPTAKSDELLTRLLQLPRLPRLQLPTDLRVTEVAIPLRPRLVVKVKQSYDTVLKAELSFDYGGELVPAGATSHGVFRPDARQVLVRDPAAEKAAEQELVRLGLRVRWLYDQLIIELKPTQLPTIARELVALGWQVEAQGKTYRRSSGFQIAVQSGQDWFDLNGTADFDGNAVPFPRLLAALRRGENTVVLDDGSLGMVPDEWLKQFGLLARMGQAEGESIRFSRTQVGVLDALLASRPEISFDRQFARARAELRRFQGVAAIDPPARFRGELRGYQREGLGWLRFLRKFGFGGCLADDMGLGKTVQVLALLAGKRNGPVLVVVPKSLIFNWLQEAARFTPKLRVLDHTGTARDRTGAAFADHDIVLTTYGTLRNDAELFARVRFDTCILDESQAAKNAATETAKAVRVVQADHRLALSGTPVENHLGELWTLFDFLNPGMLGCSAVAGAGTVRNPDAETREFLTRALRPFILRRTKSQVARDLPPKTEQTVYCDLEPAQRKLYDELRDHYRQSLLARVDSMGLARSKFQVLEALLRLRQAACHPGLIDRNRTAETRAKLDVLLPQLQEVVESGGKVLVFSQFTSLLAILRKRLEADGLTYEYLDGRTRDRAERVQRFQSDPDCRLFLISLKAGGVGLNLTAAEYVFLLDPWWNPAVEAQAIDRTHRIGQAKPVFAYRLIARGTVEEKVLALQESKRTLADAILGGDGRLITDLKREDLELLLS